jgi:hypothetical protein
MSLCVTLVIPEGIVVAGESRQTQVIGGIHRILSDNGEKVFQLTPTVLAATSGFAFLKPTKSATVRNIASVVEDFKPTITPDATVRDVAVAMWEYFNTIFEEHIVTFPGEKQEPGNIALSFAVSGYNVGSRTGEMYLVTVPSTTKPDEPTMTSDRPNAWFIGMFDVVSRLIYGFDSRALDLDVIKEANKNNNAANTQLGGLTYIINYHLMTLQDAIDFAVSMIQVTITLQRFTAGIVRQIGGAANVGGPIDIAVVRPGGKVQWVQRKELHP